MLPKQMLELFQTALVTAWLYVHCSPFTDVVIWPDCFLSSVFGNPYTATIVILQKGSPH